MIDKIQITDGYRVTLENDSDKNKTMLGVEDWLLIFNSKNAVLQHIELLKKALEFWEYDDNDQPQE